MPHIYGSQLEIPFILATGSQQLLYVDQNGISGSFVGNLTGTASYALNGGGGQVYPTYLVPFGDGVTSGGTTSGQFVFNSSSYFNVEVDFEDKSAGHWSGVGASGLWGENSSSYSYLEVGYNNTGYTFSGVINTNAGIFMNDSGLTITNFNNTLYWPTGSGSSGSALVTNGAGNLVFSPQVPTASYASTASYADTASYALSGLYIIISGSNTISSFTGQSTWYFNHNLNYQDVVVQTFDSNYNQIIPQNIQLTDANNVTITFPVAVDGYAIAVVGGTSGVGGAYTPLIVKTKSQIDTLISTNELTPGASYLITGVNTSLYGGTDIILEATSHNTLSLSGKGKFYNPNYPHNNNGNNIWTNISYIYTYSTSGAFNANEDITADNGATGTLYTTLSSSQFISSSGDWTTANHITGNSTGATAYIDGVDIQSYAVSSSVFWGGKAWVNLTGNIGYSSNVLNLNTNDWQAIPYSNLDYYNVVWDEIQYDYTHDLIIYRKDSANNVVLTSKANEDYNQDNFSNFYSINTFQWGNPYSYSGNRGVGENYIYSSYCENVNFTGRNFICNTFTQQSGLTSGNFGKRNSHFSYNNILNNSVLYNNNFSNSTFSYNTLNASYVGYDIFSAGSNLANNSYISSYMGGNTFDSIGLNNNTFNNSGMYDNKLLNSNISNNTLNNNGSIGNITLTNSTIQYNNIQNNGGFSFSNTIDSKTLQYITCENVTLSMDISSATDIYNGYTKRVIGRQDGTPVLMFIDNSNTQIIEAVTT